jgi:hypothetical protein
MSLCSTNRPLIQTSDFSDWYWIRLVHFIKNRKKYSDKRTSLIEFFVAPPKEAKVSTGGVIHRHKDEIREY